jgi:hypothetical protein
LADRRGHRERHKCEQNLEQLHNAMINPAMVKFLQWIC